MVSDFTDTAFASAGVVELIDKCRNMAAEAERLATNANGDVRSGYLRLADRWIALADEMEMFAAGDEPIVPSPYSSETRNTS